MRGISVVFGDITSVGAEALVNPANSYGTMGGGVALAIRKKGGKAVEDEAVAQAPIPVGSAVLTGGGRLSCRYVIHAPTMREPAERIGVGNVAKAVKAALNLAKERGIKVVAFPGMGTGVGGVEKREAACAMVSEIKRFLAENSGFKVILVGFDRELYECFFEAASWD